MPIFKSASYDPYVRQSKDVGLDQKFTDFFTNYLSRVHDIGSDLKSSNEQTFLNGIFKLGRFFTPANFQDQQTSFQEMQKRLYFDLQSSVTGQNTLRLGGITNILNTENIKTSQALSQNASQLSQLYENQNNLRFQNQQSQREFQNFKQNINNQINRNSKLVNQELNRNLEFSDLKRQTGLDQLELSRAMEDAQFEFNINQLKTNIENQQTLSQLANENFGLNQENIDLQQQQSNLNLRRQEQNLENRREILGLNQQLLSSQIQTQQALSDLKQRQAGLNVSEIDLLKDTLGIAKQLKQTQSAEQISQISAISQVLGRAGNVFSDVVNTFGSQFQQISNLADIQSRLGGLQTKKDQAVLSAKQTSLTNKQRLKELKNRSDIAGTEQKSLSQELSLFAESSELINKKFDLSKKQLTLEYKGKKAISSSKLAETKQKLNLAKFGRDLNLRARILSDSFEEQQFNFQRQSVINQAGIQTNTQRPTFRKPDVRLFSIPGGASVYNQLYKQNSLIYDQNLSDFNEGKIKVDPHQNFDLRNRLSQASMARSLQRQRYNRAVNRNLNQINQLKQRTASFLSYREALNNMKNRNI